MFYGLLIVTLFLQASFTLQKVLHATHALAVGVGIYSMHKNVLMQKVTPSLSLAMLVGRVRGKTFPILRDV